MARHKGMVKTGGREPGTPNKVTAELKTWIQSMIDGNRLQLEADLKALQPKDRWIIIERLMQYAIPKMQNVDVEATLELEPARTLSKEEVRKLWEDLDNGNFDKIKL